MTITAEQIKIIQTIISANKLAAYKETIIGGASNGRTSSTKELTFAQAKGLIEALQKQYPYIPIAIGTKPDPCHKMRGQILSICHTLGWYKKVDGNWVMVNGKHQLDYDRINAFCIAKGGKRFDKFTFEELRDKMVYIFQQVEKSYLSKI